MDEILDTPPQEEGSKTRHGCVTAWLIFMMAANSLAACLYFFSSSTIAAALPDASQGIIILLGLASILNIGFAVMLWKWKKFGFWGFAVTGLIGFGINLTLGLGIGQSMFGLIGIGILYAVLQIKQDQVAAWDHME